MLQRFKCMHIVKVKIFKTNNSFILSYSSVIGSESESVCCYVRYMLIVCPTMLKIHLKYFFFATFRLFLQIWLNFTIILWLWAAFNCISGWKYAFKCLVYDMGFVSLIEYNRQTKKDRDFKFSLLDMILKLLFNQYILNVRYSAKKWRIKRPQTMSQNPR